MPTSARRSGRVQIAGGDKPRPYVQAPQDSPPETKSRM